MMITVMAQLVIVSAGFDAAQYDPLGGCNVTPQGYAVLTEQLCRLAGGRICLLLEGGYHLTSISASMSACVSTLLKQQDKSKKTRVPPRPSPGTVKSIEATTKVHSKYWKSLRTRKMAKTVAKAARDWLNIDNAAAATDVSYVLKLMTVMTI